MNLFFFTYHSTGFTSKIGAVCLEWELHHHSEYITFDYIIQDLLIHI